MKLFMTPMRHRLNHSHLFTNHFNYKPIALMSTVNVSVTFMLSLALSKLFLAPMYFLFILMAPSASLPFNLFLQRSFKNYHMLFQHLHLLLMHLSFRFLFDIYQLMTRIQCPFGNNFWVCVLCMWWRRLWLLLLKWCQLWKLRHAKLCTITSKLAFLN